MVSLMVLKSTERMEIRLKHPIQETTTPTAMRLMMGKKTPMETESSMPVKPIQLAEKIQVMRTTMVFKTGKKTSPVQNGTSLTQTLEVSTMVMNATSAMAQTHVTPWSTL